MKRVKLTVLLISVSLLLSLSVFSEASVNFYENASAPSETVYVAGNPDAYPLEYYDRESKSYKGIMPSLLEKVSEETGYNFSYLYTGYADRRKELGKNLQVEIISGNYADEDFTEGVKEGSTVLRFEKDGKTYSARFGFTDIADEKLIVLFESALSGITDKEMAELAVSAVSESAPKRISPLFVLIPVALALIFLITVFILNGKYRKLKKTHRFDKYTHPLTGIGNSAYFGYWFKKGITDKLRPICHSFYIGFDSVSVSNTFGKDEYNNLMKYAAESLSSYISDKDILAVVADGAFAVVHPALNDNEARKWAETVLKRLNAYDDKFKTNVKPSFRCGIYSLKKDDRSAEKVVYNAFQGYRKAVSAGVLLAFSEEQLLLSDEEKEKYRNEISLGMRHDEFKLYLQLIYKAETDKFIAAEVLSRWEHPDKGLLKPKVYIDLIDQVGLMEEFDLYTVTRSCELLEEFSGTPLENLNITCNVTEKSIYDEHFADKLESLVEGYVFDRKRLVLEIPEAALLENKPAAKRNVLKIRELGFLIAVDNLGLSYSSFSHMAEYPVDLMKINKRTVKASKEGGEKKLLESLMAFCHCMGFRVCCKGVEDEETAEIVKAAGCDYLQGYYISRVYPVKEIKKLLLDDRNGIDFCNI